MKPARIRRSRSELRKDAEANWRYYNPEMDDKPSPFERKAKPKLPCHVPNCTSPECDRFHEGDDQ
mgnify:CR=1 FL=1